MSLIYDGIDLDLPSGKVSLTHSVLLDAIQGRSSTQNMDWTDVLGDLPWGVLKDVCCDEYVQAGTLFSLMHLDYQTCNGGISQYFFNGYDQERAAFSEHDVERYDLDTQKAAFLDLAKFGLALFPARTEENQALFRAANLFQQLFYERDATLYETVYCDEEPVLFNEEFGDYVENPDYFEPYDEVVHEDVIHGDDNFDDIFYRANDYMEELLELHAQYQCKALARNIDKYAAVSPEVAKALREHLPEAAFRKPSFALQLADAASRADGAGKASSQRDISREH